MRPLAHLTLENDGETMIAQLEGEIDLSNAEALRQRIAESVPNQALGLVVDCTEVSYLDSSGIRLLFDLARRLERRQQRLATIVPRDTPVREILEMAGGGQPLGLEEAREEAMARVRG